jgi:hypothetical protein
VSLAMASVVTSRSQELVFKNSSLEPGSPSAGSNGAVYRFPNVMSNVDALVKINGRSSPLVTLTNIDVTSSGYDKAFQPQVSYNGGTVSSAASWWMEFGITFVHKNTNVPITLTTFNATALDIDGDNSKLHEYVSFFNPASYTLETPTSLSVSNLVQTLLGILTSVGDNFDGITTDHPGIDTLATNLMVTTQYNNVSGITYRAGATTTGSSSNTNRQNSVYFKNFVYSSPIISLPVKLESFNAFLNGNKVDLKWTTSQEINVSHFVIEKSFDGTQFQDAGIVFANGNSTSKISYTYPDNISNVQSGIIYYRLRSVDIDGKSEYSEIRIIRISKSAQTLQIATYPNPAVNELNVTIPAGWQGKKVSYEVISNSGQVLFRNETSGASQTETISFSRFTPGFYIVRANCNNEVAQQKVVKQ